ncbi:MAG: hypothetical protein LC667_08565, partial [Thioalkalivibrio sp.]|nr:hypothetical protein [Thioalkalivibrio sp.]
ALWSRMCFGVREDGSVIEPNDPAWDELRQTSAAAKDDPQVWLQRLPMYGALRDDARFAPAFEAWLRSIWAEGTEATLASYCEAS